MSVDPKTPLLLLPGLLNDARLWQGQIRDLQDDFQIAVGDLAVADSMAAIAADLLRKMSAPKFAVAGLSMGGYVALEIMRQAPERISGLALLDTSARPDTPESTENRNRMIKLSATDFPAVTRALIPKLLHVKRQGDTSITDTLYAMAESIGRDGFVRQQTAIMHRIDSRPHLANIDCETLVLCGNDDAITPVDVHREMADAIPRARLEIIPECGHLSPMDQPSAVSKALREWLTRVNN